MALQLFNTNGTPIAIGTTATAIYTSTNTSGVKEKVFVYVTNSYTAAEDLTLTVGGVSVTISIPAKTKYKVFEAVLGQNVAITGTASASSRLTAEGYAARLA